MATNYWTKFDEATYHRSCREEIINPIHGKVSGTIPKWLNGTLIRNGPGLIEINKSTVSHWFDGMALLHRFEINDGVVTYQCRFIQSDVYKKNMSANRIVVADFGTVVVPDPCETIFQRISSKFNFKKEANDNTVITVYPFGDEIYAMTETGVMYKVDNKNLETKTKVDFTKSLGIVTHSSHPHITEDGTMYNLALSFSIKGLVHHIVCFPNTILGSRFDKAYIVANIPARWTLYPSYMHTFGITENYFILIEQPMCLTVPKKLLRMFLDTPSHQFMRWFNNEMCRFIVINRKTGRPVDEFYSRGFCYFHIINQYEDSNRVVIDICTFKDSSVIDKYYFDAMKNAQNNPNYCDLVEGAPYRFILPIAENWPRENGRKIVVAEQITDVICDMPTIYYDKFVGKDYRYFYAMKLCAATICPGMLIKVDVKNKTSKSWYEEGAYPSEPIFVPSPGAQDEDHGVILSCLIYGENENCVNLLVLDAKSFEEIGRVKFETSSPVPRSTHGWYFPSGSS